MSESHQSPRQNAVNNVNVGGDLTIGNITQVINSSNSIGKPFQAPPLPSYFVERPEVSQDLKKRLIAESSDRLGTLVISAIHGLGGIGKTILAQALAHDPQVREHFCDGVLWATLGQQPDVLSLLQDWIQALKDYNYKPTTVQAASAHLNSLLYDKAVLLVIDDSWNVEDIEPFRVGGGKCQVIITTRRADVAEEVNARLYSLDVMSESQSLMLLSNRLERELQAEETEVAKQLAAAVGYLPLALDLAAARIARGKSWSELYTALTAEIVRLEVLEGVRNRRTRKITLEASFNLSLDALGADFPEVWSSFVWLGVLPEDVSISAPMVATLWEVDVTEAAERLELFWNDALLLPGVPTRIGQKTWQTYRLHDLLHDLAVKWLTEEESPGLALTISEAHRILLKRYRDRLNGKKWHELADDGYIHEHLTWHMKKAGYVEQIHQLLKEETDTGKNGWHLKCDSLGKPAIFVGDVARVWRLAELEYDSNPGRAFGLQVRYCLIVSSLNTIASNIPPELITALVEKEIWTPAQGLAYARQVQSPSQRVTALSKLAPYFPEIWSEVLDIIWNDVIDEYNIARVLKSLAPCLPKSLLLEAIETAKNVSDKYNRAYVLSSLASYLPGDLLVEVSEVTMSMKNPVEQVKAISSLAPHLPENLLPKALETARNITDVFNHLEHTEHLRSQAISSLAPHLPESLLPEALKSANNITNECYRARVISALAFRLPEALEKVRDINHKVKYIDDELYRTSILSSLAPHLPESLILEALETAKNITDKIDQAYLLRFLVPYLPESSLLEALETAKNITDERIRASVLSSLAPYLSENLLLEALEATKNVTDKYIADEHGRDSCKKTKTAILNSLTPHLTKSLLLEALKLARNIRDGYEQAKILCSLAAYLPEIWLEALDIAINIKDEYEQARILSTLVTCLPKSLLSKVLETAKNISDERHKASVLSSLAPYLPESLLSEALEVAKNIPVESYQAEALISLASRMPEIRSEALDIAKKIANKIQRAEILSLLAPHLPKNLLLETLETAIKITDLEDLDKQAKILGSLIPYLSENLLLEVFETAMNIADKYNEVLEALAPHLPENLLSRALEQVKSIDDDWAQARVIENIAPYLSERLLLKALEEIVMNIKNKYHRTRILSSLALHLPDMHKSLLLETLEEVRSIFESNIIDRAKALSSLALHLPEVWSEALEATIKATVNYPNARMIGEFNLLISHIDKMYNFFPYAFWHELIHALGGLKRKNVLNIIAENDRIIQDLGGKEAFQEIADAVVDVGKWFP